MQCPWHLHCTAHIPKFRRSKFSPPPLNHEIISARNFPPPAHVSQAHAERAPAVWGCTGSRGSDGLSSSSARLRQPRVAVRTGGNAQLVERQVAKPPQTSRTLLENGSWVRARGGRGAGLILPGVSASVLKDIHDSWSEMEMDRKGGPQIPRHTPPQNDRPRSSRCGAWRS